MLSNGWKQIESSLSFPQDLSQIHRRHHDREDDHQDPHDLQTDKAHLKDEAGKDDGGRRFARRRDECLLRGEEWDMTDSPKKITKDFLNHRVQVS